MVSYLEQNPDCGFAQGASMQSDHPSLYDSTGIYLEAGFIPNQRASGKTEPCLEIPVIGPNAAGSIYRASMLKAVAHRPGAFFDNRFFAYVEDVDFNLRCTVRGYKFGYVPKAKLFHIGSATGSKIAKKKMFWGSRNLVWLVFKNVPLKVLIKTYKKILRSHLANLQFLHREQPGNFAPYLYGLIVGVLGTPLFVLKRWQNLRKIVISNDKFLDLLVPSNPPLANPFKRVVNLLK
jgi:GT2 family glycosyltransferase